MMSLVILLEDCPVLLLQAANLIHVNGLELALGFFLVCWQLLLLHRFQANGGIVTNPNDQDATTLGAAVLVVLVGEGNVDLRYIVR